MDCKLLILLAAVLHGPYNSAAVTTRLDYSQCCLDEANPTESIQQVLQLPDVQTELGFEESVHKKKIHYPGKIRLPVFSEFGCDAACQEALNERMERVEKKQIRNKRFPIHLDPLYQYRFLARSGQCPTAKDGHPEYYCPTPDKMGNWRCIDDFQLCDGVRHCPNGEDELPVSCLFFRVVETHLNSVSQRLTIDEARREQQQQLQQQQQQQQQPQQRQQQKKGPR